MNSNDRSPIWPYLAVLTGLFTLCVTAPRSWQQAATEARPQAIAALLKPETAVAPRRAAVILPASAEIAAHEAVGTVAHAVEEIASAEAVASEAEPSENLLEGPQFVASSVHQSSETETAVDPSVPAEPEPVENETASADTLSAEPPASPTPVRVSESSERIAMRPTRGDRPKMRLPGRRSKAEQGEPQTALDEPIWATPAALMKQLEQLAKAPDAEHWAKTTADYVQQLLKTPSSQSVDMRAALGSLHKLTRQADELAQEIEDHEVRSQLLRANYALVRRLSVWELAHQLQKAQLAPAVAQRQETQLNQPLAEVAALTAGSEHGRGWRQYLMLDALQGVLDRGQLASEQEKQRVAQRVLARIDAARRNQEHQPFVTQGPIASLETALRTWNSAPVEASQLIARIEQFEQIGTPSTAAELAHQYNALRWSPSSEHRTLAKQLERHYRNANVRIAVTAEFINRCLPPQPTMRSQINEQILGANVSGLSATTTQLKVRLVPEQGRVRLGLQALGLVNSDTRSNSGPAYFVSRGKTAYLCEKLIEVSPEGLSIAPAEAYAKAQSDLLSFGTDFDDVPVIRSLARSVVLSQHTDSHDDALREMEWRVTRTARERMDSEADQKIRAAADRFEQNVLSRLQRLSLEPKPLEMYTTEERLVMRLRFAGDQQLGAHTPRPRALSNSLASVQIHESVFNNALGQLKLDGQTFELPELYEHLAQLLEIELTPPDDLPPHTSITFADHDAVHLSCHEGLIHITLSIAEITQPRRKYRDFKVRAFYRPEFDGMAAEMVRDETIQLEGRDLGFGGQIVLRGVFSKIFSRNRGLPLIKPEVAEDPRFAGLEINQFAIEDGWIGFAFAEAIAADRQPVVWRGAETVQR